MSLELRPYQREAVESVYRHLRERNDNPCIVIPTAGGKTPVMATICKDAVGQWSGRVLVLAHVKELLQQAVDKLDRMAPELASMVGIYSAGLKSREAKKPIVVAGIQSAYKRAEEIGHTDLVIVDEVHMVPPDGEGMYRTLLAGLKKINPIIRIIGLTATPFRMTSGPICAPENILNHICFEVGVRDLIGQGFICPLKTKASREVVDTSGLHVRGGEYIPAEVESLMDESKLVDAACKEILSYAQDRKSVLVFTSGIRHGKHVADVLRRLGARVETVFGDTLDFERDRVLQDFKSGRLKYLVNVNVLTTGFDAPNIDCIALLRPTMSPGLFYQMVGRGFRLNPGKANCLVLDFGGNALRHGPVDDLNIDPKDGTSKEKAPAKVCPQCQSIVPAGCGICPDCGHEFPGREKAKHDASASTTDILSNGISETLYSVEDIHYSVHEKRGASPGTPRTMRVEYRFGFSKYQSEWICIEHTGFARYKAEFWWHRRSNAPFPMDAEEAVALAEAGALAKTKVIKVRKVKGENFARIVAYELGEKPAWREPGWDEEAPAPTDSTPSFQEMLEEAPF